MDSLAKRYANPFTILEVMIRQRRFYEFVIELDDLITEDRLYEAWLHKCYDKGFTEWKNVLFAKAKAQNTSQSELEATVKNSSELLNGFNPNKTE